MICFSFSRLDTTRWPLESISMFSLIFTSTDTHLDMSWEQAGKKGLSTISVGHINILPSFLTHARYNEYPGRTHDTGTQLIQDWLYSTSNAECNLTSPKCPKSTTPLQLYWHFTLLICRRSPLHEEEYSALARLFNQINRGKTRLSSTHYILQRHLSCR